MENITASEIVGEVRKMARMYEVMKRAEEVVAVVSNLEQMEREVQKRISIAKDDLMSLEVAYEAEEARMEKMVADAKENADKIRKEADEVYKRAMEVMHKAREDSSVMINTAKKEEQQIAASVEDLKNIETGLRLVIEGLEKAKDQLIAEMHAKKDQLLKAFS